PRLVGGLLSGHGDGMEVIEDPNRLPRVTSVDPLGEAKHGRPVLLGLDANQIETPALGDEDTEAHESNPRVTQPSLLLTLTRSGPAALAMLARMTLNVSVIGTGYLGAVHAAAMADLGHSVIAVDVDEQKIAQLAAGQPPFYE